MGVAGCDNRNLIDDLHIETAKVECFRLFRVVGKEPNLPQSKVLEDLKANPVVPHICFVSQSVVGFDGIHSLVLEFIGSDFLGESDPSSFLRQVNHDSASFFTNHLQSHPELIAAVAAKRIHQVSRETT